MKRLLTAYEVAKILGRHYRTVHELRKTGKLRAVALGGTWRFDPADVQDYIARQKTEAVA